MQTATRHPDLFVSVSGPVTVVSFRDRRLVDQQQILKLGAQLTAALEGAGAKPRVLLSFEDTEALSSAALSIIITFDRQVRERYGQLRLAGLAADLKKLFSITKLDKALQIFDDREKAMASFKLSL